MKNHFNFNIIFAVAIAVCLCIDISQFFLSSQLFIPLLLCTYCAFLSYRLQTTPLVIIAFLQCLESFCFYNNALFPLVYLMPITSAAFFIKKNLYSSFFYPLFFVVISYLLHIIIVERLIFGIFTRDLRYTGIQICAIILVEICFSLTVKYWDMRDNRA